jgi:hypothetical protein
MLTFFTRSVRFAEREFFFQVGPPNVALATIGATVPLLAYIARLACVPNAR